MYSLSKSAVYRKYIKTQQWNYGITTFQTYPSVHNMSNI